jgi:hypothetical protein
LESDYIFQVYSYDSTNKHLIAGMVVVPIIAAILIAHPALQAQISQIEGSVKPTRNVIQAAPIAISGENVYIVWTTDKNSPTNNSEVFSELQLIVVPLLVTKLI